MYTRVYWTCDLKVFPIFIFSAYFLDAKFLILTKSELMFYYYVLDVMYVNPGSPYTVSPRFPPPSIIPCLISELSVIL